VTAASATNAMQSVSTRRRRTLGAVALVLLPIVLADDAVAAATVASSSSMFFFGATVASSSSMGFGEAFMASIGVIFGTELGDKTFFIAAIMSMRHPRFTVWFGAVSALAAMTVLSTIVGHVAPMLLPPALTHYAAVCLFLVFGARMLNESRQASNAASDELEEVEAELSKKQATYTSVGTQDTEDAPPDEEAPSDTVAAAAADSAKQKILLQAFTLTFLAEWGDRSQIATIALAAAKEPFGVTLGAIIGHAICTGIAVIGGKLLASRISERMTLMAGGALFILFAIAALIQGPASY